MHHNHTTSFATAVQNTTDLGYLQGLVKTGNGYTRKLASARLNTLQNDVARAIRVIEDEKHATAKRAERAHKAEVKAKRSAAAKKAAATRAARKLAQVSA